MTSYAVHRKPGGLNLGTVKCKALKAFRGFSPLDLCPGPTAGGGGQQPSDPAGESIDLRSLPHKNQITWLWGRGDLKIS